MRTSRIASLVAVGAISLALSGSTATAVDASPWAAPSIGRQLADMEGSRSPNGRRCAVATAGRSGPVWRCRPTSG
jgi:hypothetical protein